MPANENVNPRSPPRARAAIPREGNTIRGTDDALGAHVEDVGVDSSRPHIVMPEQFLEPFGYPNRRRANVWRRSDVRGARGRPGALHKFVSDRFSTTGRGAAFFRAT